MSGRSAIVAAILAKDLRSFARDRFYVTVSILGLAAYVAVFWVLPGTVEETVQLGLHSDELGGLVGLADGVEGVEVTAFATSRALEEAVASGDVQAGLALPSGFAAAVTAGERTRVRLLLTDATPEPLRPALSGLVRELAATLAGEGSPVTPPQLEDVVVGTDRAGQQIPIRERMRPLFVFFVLMVEMFALATLVATELHERTISALLVTPARPADVLAAKTLLGTLLAFTQGLLLVVATGSFARSPSLLLVALLLGAVLVTGVGLIAGSAGGDFVATVFWGVVLMLPLAVPAVGALFPGSAATWIQALPSYGLVQVLVGATAYGEGWGPALPHLLGTLGWCVVAFGVGVALLRVRVARL